MKNVKQNILDALKMFYNTHIKNTFVKNVNVVNNCASTSTNYPLSAAQGKSLQDQITSLNSDLGGYAPLASPAFTGTPTAPTATTGTKTTQLATCAFVSASRCYPAPTIGKGTLANTNLNSCRVNCVTVLSYADSQEVTNLPIVAGGILRSTAYGSYCVQEYFANNGDHYIRAYNGSAWSAWSHIGPSIYGLKTGTITVSNAGHRSSPEIKVANIISIYNSAKNQCDVEVQSICSFNNGESMFAYFNRALEEGESVQLTYWYAVA